MNDTTYAIQTVENLKAAGRYFHAGALAAAIGLDTSYGCHFGLRSTRDVARAEYAQGYDCAYFALLTHI